MARSKLTSLILSPVGIITAILFFLPWLKLECASPKNPMKPDEGVETKAVGRATGWQLAQGTMTPLDSETGKPHEDETERQKAQEKADEMVHARPWFYLGVIVPVLLIVSGLLGLAGVCRGQAHGLSGLVLAALGVLVVLLALSVDYTDDQMDQQRKETREKLEKAGKTEAEIEEGVEKADKEAREQLEEFRDKGWGPQTSLQWPAWLSLVLYVVAAGVSIFGLIGARSEAAEAEAPPGAVSAGAPGQAAPQPPPQAEQQSGGGGGPPPDQST
jgi:hypothetical protein